MTERWERLLHALDEVGAPDHLDDAVRRGPRGDISDEPSARRRVVAGVVAFAVFVVAGSFAWRAFEGAEQGPVGGDTSPPAAVDPRLPELVVSFTEGAPLGEGLAGNALGVYRIETAISYGDAREKSFTSTGPDGAIVDWVSVDDIASLTPGPAAGSSIAFTTDGKDPRVRIGPPDEWPGFEAWPIVDRLPSEPGDYVVVFEADYGTGTASTARRVDVVEPGTLQIVLEEGGGLGKATASASVDGRSVEGFVSQTVFAESDLVVVMSPQAPSFGGQPRLVVTGGASVSIVGEPTGVRIGVVDEPPDVEGMPSLEGLKHLPPLDPDTRVTGASGEHVLALDAVWSNGTVGWTTSGSREAVRFFFPITIVGGESPSVAPPLESPDPTPHSTPAPPGDPGAVTIDFVGEDPPNVTLSHRDQLAKGLVSTYEWCGQDNTCSAMVADFAEYPPSGKAVVVPAAGPFVIAGPATSFKGVFLLGDRKVATFTSEGMLRMPSEPGRYSLQLTADIDGEGSEHGSGTFWFTLEVIEEGAPNILRVACVEGGAAIDVPRVVAHADGVLFEVDDTSGAAEGFSVTWDGDRMNDAIGFGVNWLLWQVPVGSIEVGCNPVGPAGVGTSVPVSVLPSG